MIVFLLFCSKILAAFCNHKLAFRRVREIIQKHEDVSPRLIMKNRVEVGGRRPTGLSRSPSR